MADTASRATAAPGDDALDDVLAGLSTFLRREVAPRHRDLRNRSGDRERIYTPEGRLKPEVLAAEREVREASAKAGFYTMLVPEDLGGAGLGYEALFRLWELVAQECGSELWLGFSAIAHWSRGPSHLLAYATPELRAEVLPDLLKGTKTVCFGMSEPDAGSDAWMMRTRATQTDGGWLLNGTKQWVTNAPYADHAFIFAITDPELVAARKGGISAFLVPTDAEGFTIDSIIEMFGQPGGDEGIIALTDLFVPEHCLVGDLDDGLKLAMTSVSYGRLYNAARSVGIAQWSLDKAISYCEDRVTFGRPIIENQGVSFPLAESAMEIRAARLMGIDAGRMLDSGAYARNEVAMAKAYATEMAVRAVDRAMQAHGAMGFTNEVGLADAWQQVRRICVADGTAEIMRTQIVRHLRRRVASKRAASDS